MNPDIVSFSLKKSQQMDPLQVPQRGPMDRDTHLQGIFISLLIHVFLYFR